jgi:hypothetical protein
VTGKKNRLWTLINAGVKLRDNLNAGGMAANSQGLKRDEFHES